MAPRFALLASLVLMAGAIAGCIGDDEVPDVVVEQEPFVDPMAFLDGHDHADYAQHDLSWQMGELGWTDIVAGEAVAWGEIDVHPDHDIAVVAFAWPTAGLATVDISNASAPVLLDWLDTGYGYGADVKWMPNGEWAVLAVQAHSSRGLPVDPLASTIEAGLLHLHITEAGEIHDIGAFTPTPDAGIHMVYTRSIGGVEYVFGAYNGHGIGVFTVSDGPVPRLEPVNLWTPPSAETAIASPTSLGFAGTHDMTVIDDPILGMPLLYASDGYDGLFIFDMSDPTVPGFEGLQLGHWRDEANKWYMHTAQAEVLDDGTRRVVLAPEVFSENEIEVVAPLWVLDATDLSDIQVEATWKNPGDHGAEQLRFSVHNFQLVDGKVAIAHYHGGVWLLDIASAANGTTVTPLGYRLPAHDPGRPMSGIYHGVYNMEDGPTVWDVVVKDGVIWATDVNSGLYAFTHEAFPLGDSSYSSIG